MKNAEPTADEKKRLEVLEALSLVYSPAEGRFDALTRMARKVFDVPIALISLVSEDRQWFKSAQGLDAAETPREISFCGHTIQSPDTFIVEDAKLHPWFADNPLVTGGPKIRFYAGQPLEVNGQRIGTICLIDTKPRQLTLQQLEKLRILAESTEEEIALSILSKGQQELLRKLSESERSECIDPLTRLWNRAGVEQVLLNEFTIAGYEKRALVMVMFALDGLPAIKKTHGAAVADAVIAEMARRLRNASDAADALGRFEDTTLIAIYNFDNEEDSASKARKLLEELTEKNVVVEDTQITVPVRAASMIAYSPARLSVASLINHTDEALRNIQGEPPGTILFYDRRNAPRD